MQSAMTVKKAYAEALSGRALTDASNSAQTTFGCGDLIPWANLQAGERVLDLGCGAGSDCIEAAFAVGCEGLVIGVDFTADMVDLAISRGRHIGLRQVQFVLGDIRSLPPSIPEVDVVFSNCTLNLVEDRASVLKEAFRVLCPGGRLLLSEIILSEPLKQAEVGDAGLFVNCVSGATDLRQLISDLGQAGFADIAPVRIGSLKASRKGADLPDLESKISSVLLRGRKPEFSVEISDLHAPRLLMLGASDAAIAAAHHYALRPVVFAKPESDIPALDAFDIIPFDGSSDNAIRKCRETFGQADIKGVVAFDGPYVGIAQALTQHFETACYFPPEVVEGGENKIAAKKIMKRAGVSVPLFWFGTDVQAGLGWSNSHGWPVVAKPANDANSRMVRLCHNSDDLYAAFEQILSAQLNIGGLPLLSGVLLEQFIEGPEFSVEIITRIGECPNVIAVCEKLIGPKPFFVEIGHAIPSSLRRESLQMVESMAIRAIQALGVINMVCHVEVKLSEDGPFIIEVNLRPPGGKLPALIRAVSGWDLHRAAIELACGLPIHTPREDRASCGIYHCITADCEAVLHYDKSPLELEGVLFAPYVEMDVAPGATVYPVNHVMGQILGRILSFGDSPSEAWNVIRKTKQSMNLTFTPISSTESIISDQSCSGCWDKGCC